LTWTGPVHLGQSHTVEGFDCGDEVLNRWLVSRALSNQHGGSSRTWVGTDHAGQVVAFYSSSTATVLHREAGGRYRRNQPDPLPALLLGRLAVDRKHAGEGLGNALVKHFLLKALEVAELVGVRLLLVHAANWEAVHYYQQFGFEPSPVDDLTMMMLVKDLQISASQPLT
jgi:GNAT superfamily N-acetyltransferase